MGFVFFSEKTQFECSISFFYRFCILNTSAIGLIHFLSKRSELLCLYAVFLVVFSTVSLLCLSAFNSAPLWAKNRGSQEAKKLRSDQAKSRGSKDAKKQNIRRNEKTEKQRGKEANDLAFSLSCFFASLHLRFSTSLLICFFTSTLFRFLTILRLRLASANIARHAERSLRPVPQCRKVGTVHKLSEIKKKTKF